MIEIIAVVLSLSGNVLILLKRREGFAAWLAANILWSIVDVNACLWGQAFLFFVYCLFCIAGWIKWKDRGELRD